MGQNQIQGIFKTNKTFVIYWKHYAREENILLLKVVHSISQV